MSTEDLKNAIRAHGIEGVEKLIKEIKEEKWDRARCGVEFLKITEGMMLRRPPERPDVNLWDGLVNGERVTLFEQDLKTGAVWCRYEFVWMVYKTYYSPERTVVQALLKDLLEEHLKWKVETTVIPRERSGMMLKEHLKWKVETQQS